MNKGNFYAASLAVVVGLFLAGCSALQAPSGRAESDTGVSIAKAAPAGGPQDGSTRSPQEGIKVHSHWLIEVRNPDGTLASRREFDNTLTSQGATVLASILARKDTVGDWVIRLIGTSSAAQPCLQGPTPDSCVVAESKIAPKFPPGTSANLVVATTANLLSVQLTGSVTAQRDGNVGSVTTTLFLCDAFAPATCLGTETLSVTFTQASVTPPQPVVTGQQIQVTVTISFS